MKKIIFTALFIFSCSFCYSQVTQLWVARFSDGFTPNLRGSYLTISHQNQIYVAGSTSGDIKTNKYNSSGTHLWTAVYNGPGNQEDYSNDIALDDSGNIYVLGSSQYNSGPGYGVVLLKYGSSGTEEWIVRDDDLNGYQFGTKILTDDSGNVYIGEKYGTFVSGTGALVKYSSSGVQKWKIPMGRVYSIIKDVSGNIIASGTINYNYFIVKCRPSGSLLWINNVPGPGTGNDAPTALVSDNNGNIYMTGTNGTKAITAKFNTNGTQQWIVNYGPPGNYCSANSIGIDNRGEVFIAGNAIYNGVSDFIILKFNPNGDTIWTNSYGGLGFNNYLSAMFTDTAGNCYLTGGSCHGTNSSTEDYLTLKYNPTGVLMWQMRYNGPADSIDIASDIFVDNNYNVYVTGNSKGGNMGYDIVTIKYSQPIGIKPISNSVPTSFALFQNYPNPFNPSTTIEFDIPNSPLYERGVGGFYDGIKVRLSVFDITGREVATLVNESLSPGTYKVVFDASQSRGSIYRTLTSGVYFYKLMAGDFTQTKRMVLIK